MGKEDKTSPVSGAYLVCKGATCKCSAGAAPFVPLDVTTHSKVYINDAKAAQKLVATVKDVNFVIQSAPFVTCTLNPNKTSGQPCQYTPSGQWMMDGVNPSEHPEVAGNMVLTENAKLKCPVFPAGEITIITHGQTVSAGNEVPEMDSAISFAINCMVEPAKTDVVNKEKVAPVKTITCGSKEAKENHKLVIRKGEETKFIAKPENVTAKQIFAPELINWSIGNCKKEDTLKTLKSDEVITFKKVGEELSFAFRKEGHYFIEGYGRQLKTYSYDKVKSSNCVFLIEVRKDNEITGISTNPEYIQNMLNDKNVYELWKGTPFTLTIKFLFALNKEDITNFNAQIEDENKNIITGVTILETGQCKENFTLPNEEKYFLKIFFNKQEHTFIFASLSNKVLKIEPKERINKVRPGTEVTFTANTNTNSNIDNIRWIITVKQKDTKENTRGKSFTHRFSYTGEYVIKAYIPFSLDELFLPSGEYSLDVLKNKVTSLKISSQSVLSGDWATLTVNTEFSDLLTGEDILWEMEIPNEVKNEIKEAIKPFNNLNNGCLSLQTSYTDGKSLSIPFPWEGIYTVSAFMTRQKKCIPLTINVRKAVIRDWTFRDKNKLQRSETGWAQEFTIYVKIPALAGREIKLNLWFDTMDGNDHEKRFKRLDITELSNKHKLNDDGEAEVTISTTSSLWAKLGKISYKGVANLFFTISDIQVKFSNHSSKIYASKFTEIEKHIFPEKTAYTYLNIVSEVTYSGRFADSSGDQIKRIITYDEASNANAVFYAMSGKDDSHEEQQKYYFKFFENKKKEEDVCIFSKEELTLDDSGTINIPIEGINESGHPGATPYLPRLFYYCIYDSKENADKNKKEIFIYPEEYGKGKKNDDYFVPLHNHLVPLVKASVYINSIEKQRIEDDGGDVALETKRRKEAEAQYVEELENEQNIKEIDNLSRPRQLNYFKQLKIAKETTANKSIGAAAVKIGDTWERKDTKCYCGKEHIDLRDKLKFESQTDGTGCFRTSKKIAEQLNGKVLGRYDCYQVALEKNNELVLDVEKMILGLKHLDNLLENGYAVVIGINHTINYVHRTEGKINEGTTDHFVVIVARYCENDKIYYQFWDVGATEGTKPEYRFELMLDNSLVCAKDHRGRKITVTQIR